VSNATYTCVSPGSDAFLGRSVGKILVDPTDPNHIYAASALGVRGLSHVIGNGGTTRTPPNAHAVGLYESTDGSATFTQAGTGNPFPATYSGWQRLSSGTTSSPYFATFNFCTGQCWYDQYVFTPKNLPDTVYVLGSFQYGELPRNTKGVGLGNNRSNGRAVLYSTTAGDPDPAANNRTFTDLTYDAQNTPATWCALPG